MAKVECPSECRVERVEQTRHDRIVAGLLDDDSHRAELAAEGADALGEGSESVRVRHLDREAEVFRRLLGPATELLLRGHPVAGRVQLDGLEALRVRAEKLTLGRPGRIEAGLPGRVG